MFVSRVAEIAQFDYDYELTTDGRYDLRPYVPYLPARYPGRYSVTTRLQTTSLVTMTATLQMLRHVLVQ